MYSRWRVLVPGMLARTPIWLGEDAVSQTLTVAQRFFTGLPAAGAGTKRSDPAISGSSGRNLGCIGAILTRSWADL